MEDKLGHHQLLHHGIHHSGDGVPLPEAKTSVRRQKPLFALFDVFCFSSCSSQTSFAGNYKATCMGDIGYCFAAGDSGLHHLRGMAEGDKVCPMSRLTRQSID